MPLAPHFDTLEYVEHKGLDLIATCQKCGHAAEMNVGKLIGNFGLTMKFVQLAPKL